MSNKSELTKFYETAYPIINCFVPVLVNIIGLEFAPEIDSATFRTGHPELIRVFLPAVTGIIAGINTYIKSRQLENSIPRSLSYSVFTLFTTYVVSVHASNQFRIS